MKKTELAIGDSTELEISFYTGMANTPETKYVEVSSNDTASGYNRLEIKADVKPKPDTMLDLTYSSYMLDFVEGKKGKLEEMKIEFRNKGKEKYKFQIIDYPEGLLEAKLSDETLEPGKKIELKVKPVKGYLPDIVKKSMTLTVQGGKEFRLTIPVKREKQAGPGPPPVKGR